MAQLKELLKWLNENQWLNLIFLILAILSIIISIYLYLKSKRNKNPVFSKRSTNVISDEIQQIGNIQVTYHGNIINNLTVTKIAIWNSGNETLNSIDQAVNDLLRVEPNDNVTIFNAEIIYTSSETNNFKMQLVNNHLQMTFDYFDENQGVIIKIVHSGRTSADLNILGTFKGFGSVKDARRAGFNVSLSNVLFTMLFNRKTSTKDKLFFAKIVPWTILAVGVAMISGGFYIGQDEPSAKWLLLILGLIYSLLSLIIIFFSRNSLPKDFSDFYTDE